MLSSCGMIITSIGPKLQKMLLFLSILKLFLNNCLHQTSIMISAVFTVVSVGAQ